MCSLRIVLSALSKVQACTVRWGYCYGWNPLHKNDFNYYYYLVQQKLLSEVNNEF